MTINKQISIRDIDSITYEILGARLAGYCSLRYDRYTNIRIIVAFSDLDAGRSNAILKLIKQFGVVPTEASSHTGLLDREDISERCASRDMTIIIQSFPVNYPHSEKRNLVHKDNVRLNPSSTTFSPHVSKPAGLQSGISYISMQRMLDQIATISGLLTQKHIPFKGAYVYLSGFSFPHSNLTSRHFPETILVPWYMMTGDNLSIERVYRQPELNVYFKSLPEIPPQIANLENFILSTDEDS